MTAIVLYAEDDENDAFFMERAFARLRRAATLRIVPTGRKVVEYLTGVGEFQDRNRYPLPGVIILDVKMPQMSGLEALAWIRTRPDFNRLPVVMFTSSTQDSDIAKSRESGANAYLVKPSNADSLSQLITAVLEAADTFEGPGACLAIGDNQLA